MLGIRKLINSDKLKGVVDIPVELKKKKVELIILPLAIEEKHVSVKKGGKLLKLLSNPIKVEKICIPSRDGLHER